MAPVPPEEIAQLMQFIAEKTKTVKSPMSMRWLATRFKEATGSPVTVNGLSNRIETYRHRIHFMKEFDIITKVKIIFALSTPVNDWFLNEMKNVADVEVDDHQRIVKYKQKDGKLELIAKYKSFSTVQGARRDSDIIQFLAEKSKTVNTPIVDRCFLVEFKTIYGCLDVMESLEQRYARLKKIIYQLSGIDKNTRIKMMFISHAKVSDRILEDLCRYAYVEVDHERRISKYMAYDGSLELEGDHSLTAMVPEEIKRKCPAEITMGMKRAREVSEKQYSEESMKVENDSAMNPYARNADNGRYDYFDYNRPNYEMEHKPVEEKPESMLEVKIEVPAEPSTSINGNHYFFDYDPPNHKEDLEHIPEEKKPESLIEVKTEVQEEPSNLGCHYEEHLEHVLIEPKPAIN